MLNVSSELYMILKTSNSSHTDTLRRPHRRGVLCGECEEGYSVVFGSGDCMKCSNWWLLTILLLCSNRTSADKAIVLCLGYWLTVTYVLKIIIQPLICMYIDCL